MIYLALVFCSEICFVFWTSELYLDQLGCSDITCLSSVWPAGASHGEFSVCWLPGRLCTCYWLTGCKKYKCLCRLEGLDRPRCRPPRLPPLPPPSLPSSHVSFERGIFGLIDPTRHCGLIYNLFMTIWLWPAFGRQSLVLVGIIHF